MSEALRLADAMGQVAKWSDSEHWDTLEEAAAELRRLHAENEALREANEAFGKRQEWWNEKMVALEERNAELVEALREMLELWQDDPAYGHEAADRARELLAKVEASK